MRYALKDIKAIYALCGIFALSACSHTGGVEVRTVYVPTPVPCEAEIAPEPEQVGDQLNGQAAHDLVIVAQSALALRIWGRGLRASLEACK